MLKVNKYVQMETVGETIKFQIEIK